MVKGFAVLDSFVNTNNKNQLLIQSYTHQTYKDIQNKEHVNKFEERKGNYGIWENPHFKTRKDKNVNSMVDEMLEVGEETD